MYVLNNRYCLRRHGEAEITAKTISALELNQKSSNIMSIIHYIHNYVHSQLDAKLIQVSFSNIDGQEI